MYRKIFAGMFILIFLLSGVLPAVAWNKDSRIPPDPAVLAAFDELQTYISDLPGQLPGKGLCNSLIKQLQGAEAAYWRGQPCVSMNKLKAYLNHTRALSPKKGEELLNDLYYRGVLLRNDLATGLPEGYACPHQPAVEDCLVQSPWPDLVAVSISTNPAQPYEGEGAFVELLVENRGGQPAYVVPVAFAGDEQEFASGFIDEIAPCDAGTLSVWWPGDGLGPHIIRAEIDPDSQITEGTKVNNTAELEVMGVFELTRPWDPSDLVVDSFQFFPDRPAEGDSITLMAKIKNKTRIKSGQEGTLFDILVRFLVDGAEVDRTMIPELAPDEEVTVSGVWNAASPGRHYPAVNASLPADVPERDPTNNTASGIVNVYDADAPLADLLIEEINFTPSLPEPGGTVLVSALIKNIGWQAAEDLTVLLMADGGLTFPVITFSDDVFPPVRFYHEVVLELLEPGESVWVRATLNVLTAGEHTVWVEVDPDDMILKTEAPKILAKRLAIPSAYSICLSDQTSWTSIGPESLSNGWSGRVDNIVIDPDDTSTMYIGTPTGGIWKSTNGGQNWAALMHSMSSLDIGAMIMDPNDSDIVYAGSSVGIYKTIDGGATWSIFIDTTIGTYVEKLILHYFDSGGFTLYAGTKNGVWQYDGNNRYLKQSTPADWTRIKTGVVTDLVQHPTNPMQFYTGIYKKGVYRSKPGSAPTGDASWEYLSDGNYGLPAGASGSARISISPSNPKILYAALHFAGNYEIYRSSNGGNTWQKRFSVAGGMKWVKPTVALVGGYWENWYNDYIVVDSTNSDTIYIGHIQAYRSKNGGLTLTRITNIHDDQHGYGFQPGDPTTLYLMGDGGIFKCTAKGAICTSLNNDLRTMMFYDIALSETSSSIIIGGTQDNGTIATKDLKNWHMLRGGDGRYVAIDPVDHDVIYSQHQYLGDTAKADGWLDTLEPKWRAAPGLPKSPGVGIPPEEIYLGDPYFMIHPGDTDILLTAGTEAYQHSNAGSDWTQCPNCDKWATIGPNPQTVTGVSGAVKRIAVDPNTNTYYAGMTSGQIWAGHFGGTSWTKIFTHPIGKSVTGLVVDPSDSDRLWVTFYGWGKTDGPLRVWLVERVESGGGDLDIPGPIIGWIKTNITGNLPSYLKLGTGWRMSNMIAVDPYRSNTVYVATDKGVYKGRGIAIEGESTGKKWYWQPFNCGLPWVSVSDLEVHSVTGSLFAATYGRSIYVNPLIEPEP